MKASVAIAALVLCLARLSFSATAASIGSVLQKYPEFSTFTDMLNKTDITKRCLEHSSITILAVDNSQMGTLEDKSNDVIDKALSAHFLLDYFDRNKLKTMQENTRLVTSIFQTTGKTDGRQGIINITRLGRNKEIFFRSAVQGTPFSSKFLKEIYTQPYNVSLLQVSNVIYTPGIDSSLQPTNLTLPAPVPIRPKPKERPVAEGPGADGQVAGSPTETESSAAEAPLVPEEAPADAPTADANGDVADADSSASVFNPSFFFGVVMALAGAIF
ncbi:hypothetical protein NMG60_11001307 [Bertholletia excelsa]